MSVSDFIPRPPFVNVGKGADQLMFVMSIIDLFLVIRRGTTFSQLILLISYPSAWDSTPQKVVLDLHSLSSWESAG